MYCSVYGCTSDSQRSQQKLNFFEFPKDNKRRKKWIEFCKRKKFQPTKASYICSLHFSSDAYPLSHSPAFLEAIGFSEKYKVLLKADAIPTEKNPLDKEIGSESKKRATGILARKKVSCNIYVRYFFSCSYNNIAKVLMLSASNSVCYLINHCTN